MSPFSYSTKVNPTGTSIPASPIARSVGIDPRPRKKQQQQKSGKSERQWGFVTSEVGE